ncbi:MAG: murein biosynthesis integral membrane protein MurJ [Polyangiaceae bacterium]
MAAREDSDRTTEKAEREAPREKSHAEREASAVAAGLDRSKLVVRAAVVALGTLASRFLGLLRDMALAALFPREATDAFFVAFTIPNALRQLLGEGAVSSAVMPVLASRRAEGGEEAGRAFFARARGMSILALIVVTVLGVVFAEPLTELFAGGMHKQPGQFERTVSLTRSVFPYVIFASSAALGMAALNTRRKFAVAAFAPGLLNVAFLIAAFTLPGPFAKMGIDPAQAIVVGALFGGVLQVVAQWPALVQIGYAGRPRIDFRDPHVRQMLKRIVPMTFGIGVYYIDLILSRRLLSGLGPGAQSYFSWAMRLCDFPQGIFVMALSTAALPSLAELAAKKDMEELQKTFSYGLRLSLFVAIPCSMGLIALAEPLVTLLFVRGQFTAADATETARALLFQGGAIFSVAAVRQAVPVFYALGDTRTPVLISAVDLLSFIAIALVLRGPLGHVGVSAAVAGSSIVQMVLLLVFLRPRLGRLRGAEILASCAKTSVAAGFACVGGWGATRLLARPASTLGGLLGFSVFSVLFLVAAWGLRSTELDGLLAAVKRRLGRKSGTK